MKLQSEMRIKRKKSEEFRDVNDLEKSGDSVSKTHQSTINLMYFLWAAFLFGGATISDARVAGKIGIYTNNYNGKSSTGINEEIIWVSIGMGITIAILITIALCYILTEKCKKRRDYFANT